jgi:hypothetical protein
MAIETASASKCGSIDVSVVVTDLYILPVVL